MRSNGGHVTKNSKNKVALVIGGGRDKAYVGEGHKRTLCVFL